MLLGSLPQLLAMPQLLLDEPEYMSQAAFSLLTFWENSENCFASLHVAETLLVCL